MVVVPKDEQQYPGSEVYEVVLVVEDTANMVPYFDVLMKSYIKPSLEFFNSGPPDPIDYGIDYHCSLYNLVTFHAGDVAPAPAAGCTLPTNSIHEIATHLEKLDLVGGAGQASSHIAEGLSTALQVFDDFKRIRHPGASSIRHCILICNSPPYHMAAEESSDYSGYNSEQLASMMGKRGIHLSIISPKKIAALQKMFDAAGVGEMNYASHPQKDYTTDPRHMVLLHGYQLQERSHSPASEDDKQMDPNKMAHNAVGDVGPFKVPSSIVPNQPPMPMGNPMSQPNAPPHGIMAATSPQMMGGPQVPPHPMAPGMPSHQHIPPHPQVAPGFPPSMVNRMPGQGGPRMSGQQLAAVQASMQTDMKNQILSMRGGPISHPGMISSGTIAMSTQGLMMVPQGQAVMASQGSMQPGHMPMMQQVQQAGMGAPMGVSSAASMTSQTMGMSNPNMMGPSMAMSQTPANFPGTSQGGIVPRVGAPQSSMNFTSMSQSTMGVVGVSTASSGTGMTAPTSVGTEVAADSTAAVRQAMPTLRDRKIIWTGALEYHEKSKATPGQVGMQQKITWLLTCRISITSTEPDLPTMNWPEKLSLQLLPKNMLSELQSLCQNSRQVAFHFSNTDQEALRNLHKLMGTGFAGCVHFPPQSASETRIILLMFSGKKKAFVGLIPNDQSAFVQGIKNVLTQHKLKPVLLSTDRTVEMYGPNCLSKQAIDRTRNQPKPLHSSMAQTGLTSISQQNLPQGQGASAMDSSVLTGAQNTMVTVTTGGTVTNQSMMSSQNPPNQQTAIQIMEAKQLQYGQKQSSANQKNAALMRQQQQQQQQLLDHDMCYPGHPYLYHHAQQQLNRQQQHQAQRMQVQPQQTANQQQLRQMLQQQQMRQQLIMQQQQQQQQQQHGRQPGPQNQAGVMPPSSQVQMQGVQMGQMGGQPTQNIMDEFNFEF